MGAFELGRDDECSMRSTYHIPYIWYLIVSTDTLLLGEKRAGRVKKEREERVRYSVMDPPKRNCFVLPLRAWPAQQHRICRENGEQLLYTYNGMRRWHHYLT